jgi:7-cyano-7-deazaguanine synthase
MPGSVVLVSGGLDSAVCLALAQREGGRLVALSFDYGQRHKKELEVAPLLALHFGAERVLLKLPGFSLWKGSSLTDPTLSVPDFRDARKEGTPSTYVPARNTVFLAFALSLAEAYGLDAIFIGVNALDYSGYADCRPIFIERFRELALVATQRTAEGGRPIRIESPLIHKTKGQIISLGAELGLPFEKTWSCYQGGERPCMACDSCRLRAKGFEEAGLIDPLLVSK